MILNSLTSFPQLKPVMCFFHGLNTEITTTTQTLKFLRLKNKLISFFVRGDMGGSGPGAGAGPVITKLETLTQICCTRSLLLTLV